MLLASKRMLNDIPRTLLGSLLLYDLDLLCYYNPLYGMQNNPLVYLYNLIDDKIDNFLIYEHLLKENLYSDDQTMQAAMLSLSGNPHR